MGETWLDESDIRHLEVTLARMRSDASRFGQTYSGEYEETYSGEYEDVMTSRGYAALYYDGTVYAYGVHVGTVSPRRESE